MDAEAQCAKGRQCQKCTLEGERQSSAKVSEREAKRPVEVAGRVTQVTGEDSSRELRAAKQLRHKRQAANGERWGGARRQLGRTSAVQSVECQ